MPIKRYAKDKGKADKLFSEIIRGQGYCEAEGWAGRPCSAQLQTVHIVTRKRSATRTDLRNAFSGCFAHHRFFHDYPREFSKFITTTWAQKYYYAVYQRSITPAKVDWAEQVEFLQTIKSGQLSIEEARRQYD